MKFVMGAMDDDEYRALQTYLIERPGAGAVIPGGHGVRKLRWSITGRGKRGGIRVIYYWAKRDDIILMLFGYPKSQQEDLTPDQLKALAAVASQEFPDG